MDKRLISALVLIIGMIVCVSAASAATTTILITATDEVTGEPLTGASVYVAGSYVGLTDGRGQFEHTHAFTASYRLGLKKTGYQYWNDQVSAGRTSLDAQLVREKGSLTVLVLDSDTLEPMENAVVSVSGPDVDASKSTDTNGQAEFEVSYQTSYIVTVKLANYETLIKTVEMADVPKSVDYLLQRNDLVIIQILDGESAVKSGLAGAELYIDNKLAGIAGSDGKINLNLEHEKKYLVGAKCTDYSPFEEEHYFGNDEILYTITLSKSLNPVTVSAYDTDTKPVSDAEVYIDGVRLGYTNKYGRSAVKQLSTGEHTFFVKKTGFNDFEVTQKVDSSVDNVVASMSFSTAEITIVVQNKDNKVVSGAGVKANGVSLGVTDAKGTLKTELITNNDYTFGVYAEGYKDYTDIREVPLGTTSMAVTIILDSSLDLAFIGIIIILVIVIAGAAYVIFMRRNRGFGRGGFGGQQRRPPRRYDGGRDF